MPMLGIIAPHPPIMVPDVGGDRSDATSDSIAAMGEAAGILAEYDPDTIVLMSPHSPAFADAFVVETAEQLQGSLGQFGAPDTAISVEGDRELANRLLVRLEEAGVPAIDRAALPTLDSGHLDHGVLVPMSFLDPAGRWPLLNLSLSYLSYDLHWRLGEEVAAAADDLGRRIAFVASGDCSHRLTRDAPAGYSPNGALFDQGLVELVRSVNFHAMTTMDQSLVESAGECGLRSFITLGGAADPVTSRVLAYEGPWGVGYLTAVVNEPTPPQGMRGGVAGSEETEIVALAREAIRAYVRDGTVLEPDPFTNADLPAQAGAFVSLHRKGQLRGCIGTIAPTEPTLAKEVVRNAIQAATADPRFPSMRTDELDDLDVKVDVLYVPEACAVEDLDPKRYGVIVSCGWKRGLLLPDLEGVDTVEDQIDIACHKAGIGSGDTVELQRFRVDRHE